MKDVTISGETAKKLAHGLYWEELAALTNYHTFGQRERCSFRRRALELRAIRAELGDTRDAETVAARQIELKENATR